MEIKIRLISVQLSSVTQVMSDSLRPHGLQHARAPCPLPTPRVYSNSCPLSRWCHSPISFSVIPFFRLQSFPASGSFQMSQFFASGGQSIGVSASASVLPMNIQDRFPLGPICESESESRSVMSDSLWPHGLDSPRNSLGQNTGVGSFSLLQGIFPTQGSNPGLLHCGQILYQLSHKGSPYSAVYKRLSSDLKTHAD